MSLMSQESECCPVSIYPFYAVTQRRGIQKYQFQLYGAGLHIGLGYIVWIKTGKKRRERYGKGWK